MVGKLPLPACTQLDQFGEGPGIENGHIGKDLSVEFNPGLFQTAYESAVAYIVHVSAGIYACDP